MARPLYRIIAAGIGLAAVLGCNRKTETAAPAVPAVTEIPTRGSLAIEAKLEEIPAPFPANDLYNYVYIMKYRVLKVLRGKYSDSVILVGHYNPRFARSEITDPMDSLVDGDLTSFNAGDVHLLALTDLDSIGVTPAVEDNYPRDRGKRCFALWASH